VTAGGGGNLTFTSGQATTGQGSAIVLFTGIGGATNNNGGDLFLYFGVPNGTGRAGRLNFNDSDESGAYATPPSSGAVTAALGPGVAITLTSWIPVVVDGVEGWIPFYS
jgi:hypothetical protein